MTNQNNEHASVIISADEKKETDETKEDKKLNMNSSESEYVVNSSTTPVETSPPAAAFQIPTIDESNTGKDETADDDKKATIKKEEQQNIPVDGLNAGEENDITSRQEDVVTDVRNEDDAIGANGVDESKKNSVEHEDSVQLNQDNGESKVEGDAKNEKNQEDFEEVEVNMNGNPDQDQKEDEEIFEEVEILNQDSNTGEDELKSKDDEKNLVESKSSDEKIETEENQRKSDTKESDTGSELKKKMKKIVEKKISKETLILFKNLDRNWKASSDDQLEFSRLCFVAFGIIFESSRSFPYSYSDDEKENETEDSVERSKEYPWIPSSMVKLVWENLFQFFFQETDSSKNNQDNVIEEVIDNLTQQQNFLNFAEVSIEDEKSKENTKPVPCFQIGSKTYQEYASYVFQNSDWKNKEILETKLFSLVQGLMFKQINNETLDSNDKLVPYTEPYVLHNYAILNYPHHCLLSDDANSVSNIKDLIRQSDFIKSRIEICGMLNAIKFHVEDCETLIESMVDEPKEEQMHIMLYTYEAVAKECRSTLEEVETSIETIKKSKKSKKTNEETKMDNNEIIDESRMFVARALHMLGYSLSKTFGFNVTAPVSPSTDDVSPTIQQQDIQYYQEALALFSLLRPGTDVNLAQADTLYCLGNCYAYQKYVSQPISSVEAAPMSHLDFLKWFPKKDEPSLLNTKAMKCFDQSFYLRRTKKGNDHPVVAHAIHAIGVLYFEIQNWDHAVGCFMESLRISRLHKQGKDNDLQIANAHEWIGYCERELNKHQSALTHFNEALILRTLHLGKRHPHVAALFYKIGIVHDDLGEMELALEKYNEALSMYSEFGLDADVETTLECMGSVYMHVENWEEALNCLMQSSEMKYKRLCDEIPWLNDPTQEGDEARSLPLPMFHNRDNRAGGSNRIQIISTSLDPTISAGLLRQRKAEEMEKLLKYVNLLDEIYTLLTKLHKARYNDMAKVLYRKSMMLIKVGKFNDAVTSLIGCKKACWLWEPTGGGLELLVETRLNGMQAKMGQYDDAIQGYRELLNRCEDEDKNMSDILYCMGNSHNAIGEYNEALSCLQKCLRIRKEQDESTTEIANIKYCIGVVYCNLRRYDISLTCLEESLEMFRKELGEEHIHVAHCLYYFGQIYQSSEDIDLDKAMKYYEEALELYRVHFSPDHMAIGHVMHSIGTIHDIRSDYSKAMLCFTDALRVYKLYNNGDHLGVATLLNSMGIVSACVKNQNDVAMTYFDAALKLRKKFLGKRHPAIADTIHNIGGVYAKLSKFENSEACYQEALDIRREYYGSEHLIVAKTMNNLGIVYTRQNNFKDAMDIFKKVLIIRRMFLEPEDEEIGTTLYNIGNIHSRKGEYDLAMVCYEEALRVRRLVLGDSHVSVANMLHNMGSILVDRKKYENAFSVLDEALHLKRIELGDDSLSFSYTLQKIGRLHEDTDDLEQAQVCYIEAMNIQRVHLGSDHVNIATILMDIGNIHKKLSQYTKALECYEEALHIREMRLGEEHELVANVFYAMGSLYDFQKEIEGAMICYGNAARILKKHLPAEDEQRIKTMEALRNVIYAHSKINGTMVAFWDTIVVTGDYWLGIEQLLLDLFELLQAYILNPTKKIVKASIKKTMKEIETIASHGIVSMKESASYGALYDGGLCLTQE